MPPQQKPKLNPVPCTQCYTNGFPECDGDTPCENCHLRGKHNGCKRVMCNYYKKDTCSNQACKRANKGDGYLKLVPFTRLQAKGEKDRRKSPLELKASAQKEALNGHEGLFDELEKGLEKKKDEKGGDDEDAGMA